MGAGGSRISRRTWLLHSEICSLTLSQAWLGPGGTQKPPPSRSQTVPPPALPERCCP